jgi:hypothetical protein
MIRFGHWTVLFHTAFEGCSQDRITLLSWSCDGSQCPNIPWNCTHSVSGIVPLVEQCNVHLECPTAEVAFEPRSLEKGPVTSLKLRTNWNHSTNLLAIFAHLEGKAPSRLNWARAAIRPVKPEL